MWTTKKELQTALKLSCVAKEENGYLHFAPTYQHNTHIVEEAMQDTANAEQAARRVQNSMRWVGHGQMRAWCALYETHFYFNDSLEGEIYVSYNAFADAVRGLDGREVELLIDNGSLWLFQGQDSIYLRGFPLHEEVKNKMPVFDFSQAHKCHLNGYELNGLSDILGQLVAIPNKENAALLMDSVTINNACSLGKEFLFVSTKNARMAGIGHQEIYRWGGVGILQIPANAARKIVHAQKLLKPAAAEIKIGGKEILFNYGRWEISSKLAEQEMINPDLLQAPDDAVSFVMNTAQFKALLKKAKVFSYKVDIVYAEGALLAHCGGQEWNLKSSVESAPAHAQQMPQEIEFSLLIDDILPVLSHITSTEVKLSYKGPIWPVWLRAGRMRYGVVPIRKNEGEEDGK